MQYEQDGYANKKDLALSDIVVIPKRRLIVIHNSIQQKVEKSGGKALIVSNIVKDDIHDTKSKPRVEESTSICASDLKSVNHNNQEGCVPQPEMEEVVHEDGFKSVEEAEKKLQCSGNEEQKELCVLEKLKKRKYIVRYFKTPTPSFSSNYWLNNTEIDTVQYQLSCVFSGYYYSNIHMIDFGMFNPDTQDVMPHVFDIKEINFVEELQHPNKLTYNGKLKSFGVVVNTDVSSGRGIHWFSIFMDFSSSPFTLEYFNSSGYDIRNATFKRWILDLADDISKKVKPCKYIRATQIQHQLPTTSNCGAYSLFYIWSRLNGTPYEWFAKNKVSDDQMTLFRKYIFRSDSKSDSKSD